MTVELVDYDVADYISAPEDAAAYLDACIEEADGDVGFIAKALGSIARARGMSAIADQTGLGRTSLYKTLSTDGKPTLETTLRVCEALGIRLRAEVRTDDAA